MPKIKTDDMLGTTYTDVVTGFTGVCTGYCQYLSGCLQGLLAPKSTDGKAAEAQWFDVQRLRQADAPRIVLDNDETPGCDRQAPVR